MALSILKGLDNLRDLLARNLESLRKARRWTQEQLAEAAGVPFRTYQDIERGINFPRQDNLEAIAKALGVTAARLVQDPSAMALSVEESIDILKKLVVDYTALSPVKRAIFHRLAALDEAQAREYLAMIEAELSGASGAQDPPGAQRVKKPENS